MEHAEARPNPEGMMVREMVVHLGEAAVAMLKNDKLTDDELYEGKEHEFGTWTPEDRSWGGAKAAWKAKRDEEVAKLPEDDNSMWAAAQYLVGHDYYHMGQIVSARLTVRPEWDAFVIYRPA